MEALIKKLVEAWGPSGYEHHVRALIQEEVADLCDDMVVDNMGNLICTIGEKTDDNRRIMIAAHMDEIGVMVSHIDRQGYLRFAPIGGVFPATLNGNRVKFEDGTIGVVSVHDPWRRGGEMYKLTDFFIDVSTDVDEHEKQIGHINVGDPAIFWRTMDVRGNRVIAKSLDDRIGCVVAIETMRTLKDVGTPHQVCVVFTVQEEVGVRGARTSAYLLDPDFAIALDVTPCGDVPKSSNTTTMMGKGAAIKVMDPAHISPPAVRRLVIDVAEANDIPYQLDTMQLGSTDAAIIQMSRGGVPSTVISIPSRFTHTTSEMVDLRDVQACIDLTTQVVAGSIEDIFPS